MHCANCSKSFPARESKCPDCKSWLVPGKAKKSSKSVAPTPAAPSPHPVPALSASGTAQATSSWDSWNAPKEDTWGQSTSSWAASETISPQGAVEAPTTSSEWGEQEDGQYGWVKVPEKSPRSEAASSGWLTDDDSASASKAVSQTSIDETADDDWVDGVWDAESMDHYSEEQEDAYSRQHDPVESPGLAKYLVVALAVLLLGGYLWSRPMVEADDSERISKERIAQDLAQGQAYFEAAKVKYSAGEYEYASSQLRAATVSLVKGEASKSELDSAYLLLAKASFKADQLLVSRDLWIQLGENLPELKEESRDMVIKADKALVARGEKLLAKAYQEYKQKRDNASRASAAKALDLFLDFGGTDRQVGRGYAALARAEFQAGVLTNAYRFYLEAKSYDKQGNYDAQIAKLRALGLGSSPQPKEPVRRDNRRPMVTTHQPSLETGSSVPTASRPRPRPRPRPGIKPPKPPTQTTSSSRPRMKEIPSFKRAKERRKRQNSSKNNSFVNYQDRTRR